LALLAALQDIELAHGRVRGPWRWGPRTLDLDLLLYGEEVVALPTLTIPHPELGHRPFVVLPLYEVAPETRIPGLPPLRALAARLADPTLIRITEAPSA
jgi:2-amino-4-hydroxy-6-hydroxymethyldihydropteridine diphosphokinase